jgi:hypothetical protein
MVHRLLLRVYVLPGFGQLKVEVISKGQYVSARLRTAQHEARPSNVAVHSPETKNQVAASAASKSD